MKTIPQKLSSIGALVAVFTLLLSSQVSAHVVVKPGEVLTGTFQTFTVGVPNEREAAVSSIKLDIPKGLQHVTPNLKTGWTIDVEKEGTGEDTVVKSITWSGSSIAAGFREEFNFSARTPDAPTELQWSALQTYEDGQAVAWNLKESEQPKKADGSPDFSKSGPFSVTKIVKEAASGHSADKHDDDASEVSSDRASYLGAAGIALGLAGIFLATRKRA